MARNYPCPCCGYMMFSEPPGSYEICKICFWEDDNVQLRDPFFAGGANVPSLLECQRNFEAFGACERRFLSDVRSPTQKDVRDPGWRLLDPERDNPERCLPEGGWERPWPDDWTQLYWWRPTYWRKKLQPNDQEPAD
jgi:hypothetical protein